MVYACNGLFAKLWIFQLQNSVFFTCNFLHFYLTTNTTAVFAAYDDIAIGAIRAVNDEGLKVPDDISIIGIDNIRSTDYSNPPLTTVAGPIVEMGKIALKLLFKKITCVFG